MMGNINSKVSREPRLGENVSNTSRLESNVLFSHYPSGAIAQADTILREKLVTAGNVSTIPNGGG